MAIAKETARMAGKKIMEIYDHEDDFCIEHKQDHSPLTKADKAANKIILEALRAQFPDYAFLSEEEKDTKERLENDYCFIIDPLDGTKEFIKRNGQFTVNIALSYCHKAVMGVIYAPARDELYYAAEESGAYMEAGGGQPERLHVTDTVGMSSLRFVVSNSHNCKQMDDFISKCNITKLVKVGSSLKGCMVAKGAADAYYRFNPTMEWDTAAMQCIAEEAGGLFRQIDGSFMTYNRNDCCNSKGFCVINRMENMKL